MSDTVTVPIDYNEPIADNGACVGDFLEAEVKRLRKALDEARSAKVSDADTVIVPRWALQHVLDFAMQDRHVPDTKNTLANFASAHRALLRALDTKTGDHLLGENKLLRASLQALLACPDIADNDCLDEETLVIERAARAILKQGASNE